MKRSMHLVLLLCLVLVLTLSGCSKPEQAASSDGAAPAARQFVTIGTGGVTGVYYPTGGAISKMVNNQSDTYNLKVTVESTGGSVYNVNGIMSGDLEFGIVQSDRQYQAYYGTDEWEEKPQEGLRAVFSIHPESISLLAADDAQIETFTDLIGKVVNIGNPGSGQRGNAIDAFSAFGIDVDNDINAQGLQAAESASALQDGQIDAYFYTVGHPNGSFKEATAGARKAHFVDITGPAVDALIEKLPFYANSVIAIKDYPNASNTQDVKTFGVKATLCTSAAVSDEIVYAITREVFENFEEFKTLHPAYANLQKEDLLAGLSAPIHDGAMKYYQEVGLK